MIVLFFLLMGTACAHDDFNATADNVLKDTEYTSGIDDDGKTMEVGENDYIPVEVSVDEAYSLNIYIDRKDSSINGDLRNASSDRIDVPTTVMNGEDEVSLAMGRHSIVYEFTFTNTTSIYRPTAYVIDSVVTFDFNFIRTAKNPQNAVYRFSSQFNIIEANEPVYQTLNLGEVTITSSDSLSFALKGLSDAEVDVYIDGEYLTSLEADENPFEDEINTANLKMGSYDLMFIVKTGKVRGEYNVEGDTSKSEVSISYVRSKVTSLQNTYITTVNAALKVAGIPEMNTICIDAPPVEVTRTRSVPVRFSGDDAGNLTVYIDGEKVYDSQILLSWQNTVYIPTRDSNGAYFDAGVHDLTFEFLFQDRYRLFNPQPAVYDNIIRFDFTDSQDTSSFTNEKYVIKSQLTITDTSRDYIPVISDAPVTIIHTNDISLKVEGINGPFNLTVFVDDGEIYDEYTNISQIPVRTFIARSSIEETNERDIKVGVHNLRFEFTTPFECDAEAEFENGVLNFKFTPKDSVKHPEGIHYQFNTTLTVTEKPSTVHIIRVKNHTYFDDTEFIVMMDLYEPEEQDDEDEDDDEPYPVGTQDVGIIVSDENGIIYTGDYLMNVYDVFEWNYDFENNMLPKAGDYTMKIINLADNTYDTIKFTVKKADRTFNRKYSTEDFNVLFRLDFSSCRSDLNSPLTIELAGDEKTVNVKKTSSNTKKEVLFEDITPGTYTATFTLKGNGIYNDAVLKSKVTVKKEDPQIKYHKTASSAIAIEIDIPESKNDAELTVTVAGIVKKFTVDKNTKKVTADFTGLPSGEYKVEIEFRGNDRYSSKNLTGTVEITHYRNAPLPQENPHNEEEKNPTGTGGAGNGTGGTGTGEGDGDAPGSGNGTYNGKITFNGKGFDANLGTQGSGSGNGEGPKGYEITKNAVKKINESANALLILAVIALAIWILGFIYERRDDDEEEY